MTTEHLHKQCLVFSNLKPWDKLYINGGIIEPVPWSIWQPVNRYICDYYYGGSNRVQLIEFIKELDKELNSIITTYIKHLNKPYVKENLKHFKVINSRNGKCIQTLKMLYNDIPGFIIGIFTLCETYRNDITLCEELAVYSRSFQDLLAILVKFNDDHNILN